MLYALGVGAGVDDLAFTTNNTRGVVQRMLPTMPVTLGFDTHVLARAGTIDWTKLVHAEQSLELYDEVPPAGQAITTTRIAEMWDKQSAALVVLETEARAETDRSLWRSRTSLFVKGAGGWGGERGPAAGAPDLPERPDETVTYRTRPDQALLYRLSGDYNPLHSDPAFARRAGFPRPILHGLCTFGFAGRALLRAIGGIESSRLRGLGARFAAPVFPGDTLHVDLWRTDAGVAFRTRTEDGRDVLTAGWATIAS
jgi:acyl dehydratase